VPSISKKKNHKGKYEGEGLGLLEGETEGSFEWARLAVNRVGA
jgi:hypothetical protein